MWLADGSCSGNTWATIFCSMRFGPKHETVEFGGTWGVGGAKLPSPSILNMDEYGKSFARMILKSKVEGRLTEAIGLA